MNACLDLGTESRWVRLLLASACAAAGDKALHHEHCQRVLDGDVSTYGPGDLSLGGITCSLHATTTDKYDQLLLALERITKEKPGDRWLQHPLVGLKYRCGHFAQVLVAVSNHESRGEKLSSANRAVHLLWAAMAHQKLQRPDDARSYLKAAIVIIDDELPKPGEYLGKQGWVQWIECQVIRHEAEGLIIGTTD